MAAPVGGAVCVFAKCPIPGRSKTRLAPLLGEDGAASLATAMLSDILVSLASCDRLKETLKVLVYAPGTSEGEAHMNSILQRLNLSATSCSCSDSEVSSHILNGWVLLPMASGASKADLTSSSLGSKLEDALEKTRKLLERVHKTIATQQPNEAVVFLGMDAPELPLEEIVHALQTSSSAAAAAAAARNKAHMCPADDGGYGMLSVPRHAPASQIFNGVRWSSNLTAVSQLKALSDCCIDISIGKMMNDVDEPEDVFRLAKRLICSRENNQNDGSQRKDDVLESFSSNIIGSAVREDADTAPVCQYTWEALFDLGVISKTENGICINDSRIAPES